MPERPKSAYDHFPLTRSVFRDPAASRAEVLQQLMATYYEPLKIYYLGTRDRWLGEPDEIVHGFFASRLSKGDFLDKWRREGVPRGRRLSEWLRGGLRLYLREHKRGGARDRRSSPLIDDAEAPEVEMGRDEDLRFLQESLIRPALERAHAHCKAANRLAHWEIFYRSQDEGVPQVRIAEQLGIPANLAKERARYAAGVFEEAVRDRVRELFGPELSRAEIDTIIRNFLDL